ncbi:flavin reductase [Rhodococcus hoagii]|nr:flavin reductase [Prescottella equi]
MSTEAIAQEITLGAEPTPADMRRVMGQFATGVTVVTGLDDEGPVGFACQSFASVSLEPPLILICADHRGRACPASARPAASASTSCTRTSRTCAPVSGRARAASTRTRLGGLRWGTPSLPDVLMRVHAEVHEVHVAGDHDIIIGRVLELDTVCEERPMVFFRGKFGIGAPELV